METLRGTIENIIFRNEDNGYTVLSARPIAESAIDLRHVTVVTKCATLWEGEDFVAEGDWVDDYRHGRQFRAEAFRCVTPTSKEGLCRYLASGLLRGVGPKMAEKIVATFGEDTLEILDRSPERLHDVRGIGKKKIQQIIDSWIVERGSRETLIFLQGQGITASMSTRIWKRYGVDAIAILRQNPYRLAEDVRGIGFLTADRIALNMGIPRDSAVRAEAGLLHCLKTAAEDHGHLYLKSSELLLAANEALGINVESLAEALNTDIERRVVVQDDDRVYLHENYVDECIVAKRLSLLLQAPFKQQPIDASRAVAWAEKKMGLTLAGAQWQALAVAVSKKVAIITGGPGVGKTTIIRALREIFGVRALVTFLAAPTGRAAKRMSESTGFPATTLHRLLKYQPQTNNFFYHREKPIEGDVFIIDESSMLDLSLMRKFIEALPLHARLIFVGDTDQLPSVGAGNVLGDMIASSRIPCVRLTTIFRQDARGYIVRNAHHVNAGQGFELPPEGHDGDFYFMPVEQPHALQQKLLKLVLDRIPAKFHLDPLRDVQILTPMRRGDLGTDALNQLIQRTVNPKGNTLWRGENAFRVNDRVMQIANNYDKDVFNGDIGFIVNVDTETRELVVDYDKTLVKYKHEELDELVLAYATSIHKSQGSEYPAVVILLHTQHFKLLRKNLLYTAITRGKRLVIVMGSPKAINIALRSSEDIHRQTMLAQRIGQALDDPSIKEPSP